MRAGQTRRLNLHLDGGVPGLILCNPRFRGLRASSQRRSWLTPSGLTISCGPDGLIRVSRAGRNAIPLEGTARSTARSTACSAP
jgi:hypothetical protein